MKIIFKNQLSLSLINVITLKVVTNVLLCAYGRSNYPNSRIKVQTTLTKEGIKLFYLDWGFTFVPS